MPPERLSAAGLRGRRPALRALHAALLSLGVLLLAGGQRIVRASLPPGADSDRKPSVRLLGAVAPLRSPPGSGRALDGRTRLVSVEVGAKLTGTVILPGGKSYALFRTGNDSWRVREGQDVRDGVRLLEVKPDCVVVEEGGIRSTIRFSWVPEPPGRRVPRPAFRRNRTPR